MQLTLTRIIYLLQCLNLKIDFKITLSNWKSTRFIAWPYSHVKSDLWKLKRFNISRFPSGLLGFQAKRPEQCLHSHVSFRSHTHARKRGRQCLATVWAEAMLRPWAGQSWVTKSMFSMTVFNSQQYRADD